MTHPISSNPPSGGTPALDDNQDTVPVPRATGEPGKSQDNDRDVWKNPVKHRTPIKK